MIRTYTYIYIYDYMYNCIKYIIYIYIGMIHDACDRMSLSEVLSCNRDGMEALRKGQTKAVGRAQLASQLATCDSLGKNNLT